MRSIPCTKIGAMAAELFPGKRAGKVMGVTSRGAFLNFDDRILFITTEGYNSPFNLTLEQTEDIIEEINPGDPITLHDEKVLFPSRGVSIDTRDAVVWTPAPPTELRSPFESQLRTIENSLAQLRKKDPEKGLLFLADKIPTAGQERLHRAAGGLLREFRQKSLPGFLDNAAILVGAGGGLTPSGDDFLAGFLLYHFRLAQVLLAEDIFLGECSAELIRLAAEKTTTISTNRLMAAARGWAEDLFLNYIDHLFDEDVSMSPGFINHLFNFGHSSGIDTLVGIYYAVKSFLPAIR